jgi:hypothetical protein
MLLAGRPLKGICRVDLPGFSVCTLAHQVWVSVLMLLTRCLHVCMSYYVMLGVAMAYLRRALHNLPIAAFVLICAVHAPCHDGCAEIVI